MFINHFAHHGTVGMHVAFSKHRQETTAAPFTTTGESIMAAKKSSKVKDLPRKSVSSKKAANVKGGARQRPK